MKPRTEQGMSGIRLQERGIACQQADQLSTSHLLRNLERRTLSSGVVRGCASAAQFALMLGYNVVLARLLTAEEFGLVAMVATVVGFLQIFRDMGLSTATIQKDDITQAQVSNLFWLNAAFGCGVATILCLCSPLISWYYREPRLTVIVFAMSTTFIMGGLSAQHIAVLNRQMRFLATAAIEVSAVAAGVVLGISLALWGCSHWSLVIGTVAQAAVRTGLAWAASRWRPQALTTGAGTRALVRFGANVTAGGLIYSISRGLDGLLIGRVFGAEAIGIYSRAGALMSRPIEQLSYPLSVVMLPGLSRLNGSPHRYRAFFLAVFETIALAGFAFAALLMPLANQVTTVLLGDEWVAAGPIFGGLCLAAVALPLSTAISWLFTSQGRTESLVKVTLAGGIATVGAVVVGLAHGPLGVAVAISASSVLICLPVSISYGGKVGPVSRFDLWRSASLHFPVFVGVMSAVWFTKNSLTGFGALVQLVGAGSVGVTCGVGLVLAWRPSRDSVCRLIGLSKVWKDQSAT